MKAKAFRVSDALWQKAHKQAQKDDITVSEMLRKFLREWTRNI